MELDGEVLTKCDPVLGYLHRGDEKIAENMTYNQFVPYTDRLDYLAPLANNMAYAIAVEQLWRSSRIPARCQAIRVHHAASWRAFPRTCSASAPSASMSAHGRCSCTPSPSARSCTVCSRN
jgi:hypothetical protein